MAGSGYRAWVAGERLDYDDLQSYIQDQTLMVFASTAARDAAITAPAEGMRALVTGTDRIYTYDGSAWVVTGWYASAGRVGTNLRRNAVQAIAATTLATITWDAEDQDTDGFIAVSATTVTIPSGLGGLYVCTLRMQASATVTSGQVYITAGGEIWGAEWIEGGSYGTVSTGIIPLVATNTVVAQVYNGGGSSRDYTGRLTVYRVGP